jgi:LmbE family N-acetylglucosaminyl deacetylase
MDSFGISSSKTNASTIIIFVYVFLFILVLLYFFVARRNRAWMEFTGKRVLLITAHPDDECMFFGPVIYHACKEASSFSLLCLTKGKKKTSTAFCTIKVKYLDILTKLSLRSLLTLHFFFKGDYNGEGNERKQELLKSCKILGIRNVTTLDNEYVQVEIHNRTE